MTRPEVRIYEVGPRDGLQAEATLVATDAKLAFIGITARSGSTSCSQSRLASLISSFT